MFKSAVKYLMMSLVTLSGCTTIDQTKAGPSADSNCAVGGDACLLPIIHDTSIFGYDRFTMSADPARPPSNNGKPVDVYWLLPGGYVFRDERDGPQLSSTSSSSPFVDGYVTNFRFQKVPSGTSGVGYHWTINRELPNDVKYDIVFHELGSSGPVSKWVCDPTIASFANVANQHTTAKPGPLPRAMNCTSYPGQ